MRSTFKILFYINRQKTKADGNTAILCRITIDGKNTAITTGEECQPAEWNSKQGLTTNRKTNQRINEFRELVEKTYRDILTRDGVVSVELIKNRLQGIATNPTTLLTMSKAELQSVKESVGKSRAEGTYLNLSHSDRNLREFIKDKGVQDISIVTITESLFEEYRFFLKKRGLKASTVNTNLSWLSRLMFRAVSSRIIRCNSFENAKYEKEEKKIRFLQKGDVMKLMAMTMNDRESELARLMFVFSCFTGLAISDVRNLREENIVLEEGELCIKGRRMKTKTPYCVQVLPPALTIMNRHRGIRAGFIFDVPTTDIILNGMHYIQRNIDMGSPLTFHMARHTFSTTICLSNGISMETLSKMLGHSNIGTTQIYGKITDHKIQKDMTALTHREHSAFENYCESIARQSTVKQQA